MPFKGTVMHPVEGRNFAQYGEIPAFPVGSRWANRRELCDSGVHCHLSGGIHGRGGTGAFSVVLSGGYADDVDMGEEFTYTGQGGQAHREVGAKWNNVQVRDQEWKLGNLALRTSCTLKKPVRVVRGSGLDSPHAPAQGYRYDGLYFVKEAFMKPGVLGFQVCLFRFVRCPMQAPLPGPIATRPEQRRKNVHSFQSGERTHARVVHKEEDDDEDLSSLSSTAIETSSDRSKPRFRQRVKRERSTDDERVNDD
ncbi:hypothetical protein D9619_004563 [Psilocybe cf. subviscida]|uniref:YDG domain-containing protein n=1 Tax=Psilocybe cf. subviscida TaxID=2480587 RepID=A0A8H5BPY4_9AGAR|nr:hypothetical protein D9619_004563 [Psilocybe cf. subviscida]